MPNLTEGDSPDQAPRNFWVMVGYQVALRTGWIFKTESVVMPSFLDYLAALAHFGDVGWMRGLLPIFNRLGQSIPPMVSSHWLSQQPYKKSVVATTTLIMACCFLTLAAPTGMMTRWSWISVNLMPILFVVTYAVFFSVFGINQLAQNTLQGKVIPVRRRGALMSWSSLVGVAFAVTAAALLLPRWLQTGSVAFEKIFGVTGTAFLIAGLLTLAFRESPDTPSQTITWRRSLKRSLGSSFWVLWHCPRFRSFGLVAAAFGMNMVLFPHYQALFRSQMETGLTWLMPWLAAQNLGAAFFSAIAGKVADRIGNGLALRALLLLQITIPMISLGCAALGSQWPWFTVLVFFVLGSTPVTFRVFSNFTLELVDRPQHTQYLSALAICLSVPPMLLSVPMGMLVDRLGFPTVFGTVSGIGILGFLLMLSVPDPRHQAFPDQSDQAAS